MKLYKIAAANYKNYYGTIENKIDSWKTTIAAVKTSLPK